MSKQKLTYAQQEAYDDLKKLIRRGETVYCILRHVSRSGMMRKIDLFVMRKGEPRWISYRAAKLLGYSCQGNGEGIKITGCGMDMGFALVYELSRKLWPQGCRLRKGEWHNDSKPGDKIDGGYALKHRWL